MGMKSISYFSKCFFEHKGRRLLPAIFLLLITYTIFSPSVLFLTNINDFSLPYIKIVPFFLICAFLLTIFTLGVAVFINDKILHYYIALLFSICLGFYVQENFLNPQFPDLDGAVIDWSIYGKESIISSLFWGVCMVVVLLLFTFWGEKVEKAARVASYFLSAVQLATLVVLILTTRLDESANYGFSKEGEFALGTEENIVLFVVDTLQSTALDEYLTSDNYTEGRFDDFVFYDNAVSGGAPTQLAMPVLLTGNEYDPMQMWEKYKNEAWKDTKLYDVMIEKGYDIRFYTDLESVSGFPEDIIDNYAITGESKIVEPLRFIRQFYKLVNFRVLPQFLKKYFWLSTSEITDTISKSDSSYRIDDVLFYNDMQKSGGLDLKYKKAFRLYHLNGVHAPYNMNESFEKVEENSVTEGEQLCGVMKEIDIYIDRMKQENIYDKSLIIITGDHGRHESGNLEANPAVLIKKPYEKHPLKRNSVPIHFRNVVADMASVFMDDYSEFGPSTNDITFESDVERLHTVNDSVRRRAFHDRSEGNWRYERCIIKPDADYVEDYEIYDSYEINRIAYKVGEKIEYTNENEYGEEIDYRIYKEDNVGIASNELSICFELDNYKGGDLEFHFKYSKIYNTKQDIRFYVNGERVETKTCTKENVGLENIIIIPESTIKDNIMVLRMVFPNAITPNQLDRNNKDTRVLSVAFESMWLEE